MLKENILFFIKIYSTVLSSLFFISNLAKALLFLTLLINSKYQLKGKKSFYIPIQIQRKKYSSKFDKLYDIYTNEIFNLSSKKIETGYYLNLKKKIKTFGLEDLIVFLLFYFFKLNRIIFCVHLFIIIKNKYNVFDYIFSSKYNCNDERFLVRYNGE